VGYEPIYYVDGQAGELLCVDHADKMMDELRAAAAEPDGNPLSDEDEPAAVMSWDSGSGESVLWCGNGHSFCGSCGSDMDNEEIRTPFARCWNCGTESVFVDGIGFIYAGSGSGSWADVLETETVEVSGGIVPLSDTNGFERITDVLDISGRTVAELRVFVGFHDSDPSLGSWLVLSSGSWTSAHESFVDELRDRLVERDDEPADEDEEPDFRAGCQLVELTNPADRLVVTSKKPL